MYWVIIILVFALILFLVWASADVGSNIYLKALCKGDGAQRVVSLTFDDGPDEQMTPLVLDVLKQYNIKATFFLVGSKVDNNPDIVRRIVAEGHIVANHTYSHSGLFPLSSKREVKQELERCNTAIKRSTGLSPKLFRPPFGVTNPIIGAVIKSLNLKTIGWSIRSLDTMADKSRSIICQRVKERLHPGAIILLHDRCDKADELLKEIIQTTLKNNYNFISVDKMLKINPYEK